MAAKILLVLVALAMLATQAKASVMLEKFEDWLNNMTMTNFIVLLMYQFWGFASPMLKGVIDVILKYIWDKGQIEVPIDESTKLKFGYAQALGFVGIGNYDQLSETFMEIFPKILTNKIVPAADKVSYGSVADNLLKKLNINL